MGNQKYTIQRQWEHKTQDEDKQNKKNNTAYQKDDQCRSHPKTWIELKCLRRFSRHPSNLRKFFKYPITNTMYVATDHEPKLEAQMSLYRSPDINKSS